MPRAKSPTQLEESRVATTVKLDPLRHRRLRLLGVEEGRSSQAILVDALDAYLQTRESLLLRHQERAASK